MDTIAEKKFRFIKFPVYREARVFVLVVRNCTVKFLPPEERYVLTSQLLRAADSIVLNIAEGSARSTDRDFAHYLTTSFGSLNEVVACIDLAFDRGFIRESVRQQLFEQAAQLANQLTAFRRTLVAK